VYILADFMIRQCIQVKIQTRCV